jgi:hypothetical protein
MIARSTRGVTLEVVIAAEFDPAELGLYGNVSVDSGLIWAKLVRRLRTTEDVVATDDR